ncbi:MAG: branched-chain amino acid ABC transporter substrate-binding protein [Deltaproteobacteria bacterium]|nr:branched-chain amino acid ABC transporter substrate-binding protein [Deltaproteobacteria bacterium]
MKKSIFTFLTVLALTVFSSCLLSADPVKIGLMAPITGAWAAEGEDMVRVVEILVQELNDSGGINGEQVVLEKADDGGEPKNAALAAQMLITSGVVAVVGTYGSTVTEATQDLYDEAGIVQVATGSTSIRLTDKGLPLFFRTCPRDDEQGRVLANEVIKLGYKKVAIVHDNSAYAKGLADEARKTFQTGGVEEVYYDAITPGDRDFNASLTAIQTASPDIIVFTGYFPEAGLILRQKREMNWDIPIIGGDATNNTALVEIAGNQAADGYYFVSPPALADMNTPAAAKLMETYKAKFDGAVPSSVWSVLAGDAFEVIVEAVKAVGPDPVAMATWLKTDFKDYQGFSGPIAFDDKGDRIGEVYRLYKVDANGQFVLQ